MMHVIPQVITTADYLFRVDPPWVYIGLGEPERKLWIPSAFYSRPDIDGCVRQLRGWKMRTRQGLMDEFGAALQFFDRFGENWPALLDCLSSLDEWIPAVAYVIIVEAAEQVLCDDEYESVAFDSFLKTLNHAGNRFSIPTTDNDQYNRPAIPFHVLLNVSLDAGPTAVEHLAERALQANVPIRR